MSWYVPTAHATSAVELLARSWRRASEPSRRNPPPRGSGGPAISEATVSLRLLSSSRAASCGHISTSLCFRASSTTTRPSFRAPIATTAAVQDFPDRRRRCWRAHACATWDGPFLIALAVHSFQNHDGTSRSQAWAAVRSSVGPETFRRDVRSPCWLVATTIALMTSGIRNFDWTRSPAAHRSPCPEGGATMVARRPDRLPAAEQLGRERAGIVAAGVSAAGLHVVPQVLALRRSWVARLERAMDR